MSNTTIYLLASIVLSCKYFEIYLRKQSSLFFGLFYYFKEPIKIL
jgi:hypothetical protein